MNGGDCGDHQDRAAALQRDKCKLLRLVNYLCGQGHARGNTKAIDLALGCNTFERHLHGPEPPANVSAQDSNAALKSDVVHLVLLIGAMGNISGPWEKEAIMNHEVVNRHLFHGVLDNGGGFLSPSPPPPRVKIIINTAAHTIMELPSRATIRRVSYAVDVAASRAI